MSTWTSKVLALAAVLGLAACDEGVLASLGLGEDVGRTAPTRLDVAGGAVTVAGPRGYCIDRSASREDQGGAFVLLGSCASIAGNTRLPHPDIPGILTVTVSPTEAPADDFEGVLSALDTYLQSNDGRAALSRSGRSDQLDVLSTEIRRGTLYIRARDTSEDGPAEIATEYWRALLGINGRLVSVSVVGFEEVPMTSEQGLDILNDFMRRMRAENRG